MNIKTAFLNNEIEKEIYLEISDDLIEILNEHYWNKVLQLWKAHYRLKQLS